MEKTLVLFKSETDMSTYDWSRNLQVNDFGRYLIVHAYDESERSIAPQTFRLKGFAEIYMPFVDPSEARDVTARIDNEPGRALPSRRWTTWARRCARNRGLRRALALPDVARGSDIRQRRVTVATGYRRLDRKFRVRRKGVRRDVSSLSTANGHLETRARA
jgi:hypothetical protein